MVHKEIRLGGFGGQGIITAGKIVGKAAAIFDKKNAVFTQSYGPEARGGACSSEVVVSEEDIAFPKVQTPDIVILMSQEAYVKFGNNLPKGAIMLTDSELVKMDKKPEGVEVYSLPATSIANELGKRMVANIVMIGFLAGIDNAISEKALRESVLSSVPKGTEELNTKAFEKGLEHGRKLRGA